MSYYPSLPKTLLLATILSTGLATPLLASATEEVLGEESTLQTAPPAPETLTDISLETPAAPAAAPAKSGGFFSFLFGGSQDEAPAPAPVTPSTQDALLETEAQSTAAPDETTDGAADETVPSSSSSSSSTQPSAEPAADPAPSTSPKVRSLLNVMTFGWLGSAGEEVTTASSSTGTQDGVTDEAEEEEAEVYTPPADASSSTSVSHLPPEILEADAMDSVMLLTRVNTKNFEEAHLSFPHPNWPTGDVVRPVDLPTFKKNFSLYPQGTYTLVFGNRTLTIGGIDLDKAVRLGRDFSGVWLSEVKEGDNTLKTFQAKEFDIFASTEPQVPAYVAADHLFFNTLKAGAYLNDATPAPKAIVTVGDVSVVLSEEDEVFFKPEGVRPQRVAFPYVQSFLANADLDSLELRKVVRGSEAYLYSSQAGKQN